MTRILIIEDEPQMCMGLKDNLEFEGYTVLTALDGKTGLQLALSEKPDLILLDIMLPLVSGLDVCKELRNRGLNTPVIMLTARGEEGDKVLGLELGADDYITKPFGIRELLSRIKAVLRRAGKFIASSKPLQIGRLHVDFEHYSAWENGKPVELSHREFELLKYFVDHAGETVSREQLLEKVWGYQNGYPDSRTVDNFIVRLRKKIETEPKKPKHLFTVYGFGYKLIL